MLVFAPVALGAVDIGSFLVVQGLAIAVMILWAVRIWVSPKPQLLWPPICWVVLAFALCAVARYLTADIEYVARQEMIQVLIYAFLFLAIVNNLYRQEMAQIISFTLIFLGMVISGYAIYQFITHSNRVWYFTTPYPGRASGTYISPNNLAGFLEMLLPLAVSYTLTGRIKPATRILLGYAALVMAVGLVMTFSRGGWVAAGIGMMGLLGILVFQRNHWLPALLLLLVLLGGGVFFVKNYLSKTISYKERVEAPANKGGIELEFRGDMWRVAEQMWLDHFWWGVGPAHYDYRFREYRPEGVQGRPDRAHNDYLNLLADWGTVGGVIVLAGMAAFGAGLSKTWRHVRRENDFDSGMSNRFAFFLGASTGLLALAAHSCVDFNLHIPANAIIGVTLLALLTSNLRFATEHYWVNARLPVRTLPTIALACGIVYLGRQEWRRGAEVRWLAQAESPNLLVLDRAKILEKAFAVEPDDFDAAYNIGEAYRMQSFQGGQDYQAQAETAMLWYSRGMLLNRYEGYNYLRTGMCLDWLGQNERAKKFYSTAELLDPNGYFTAANIGWHYVQTGDYAAAREYMKRSLQLQWDQNPIAQTYLDLVEQKLIKNASGKSPFPSGF